MQVRFSDAAEADLLEIALFIAQDNPDRALSFVDELEDQSKRLGKNPLIGAARPELGEGIRVLPYGRYMIFHQPRPDEVFIVRVLHSARDIDDDDLAPPS